MVRARVCVIEIKHVSLCSVEGVCVCDFCKSLFVCECLIKRKHEVWKDKRCIVLFMPWGITRILIILLDKKQLVSDNGDPSLNFCVPSCSMTGGRSIDD